jgi:hypothetical protein
MNIFTLSTKNVDTLPLPSPLLFDIHRRFSSALHLFSSEDKIAKGWPAPQQGMLFTVCYYGIDLKFKISSLNLSSGLRAVYGSVYLFGFG